MATQPQAQPEPRILRVFVSYASEDILIATAIATAFRDSLPAGFADVCFDKWFMEMGIEFKRQIEAKLEKSDVFISVYTGVDKPFASWELGFFEALRRIDPRRRIVPLYLERLPQAADEYQGRSLNIPKNLRGLSVDDFSGKHNLIAEDDPMCALIEELQEEVERIKDEGHYPKTPPHERRKPVECVKNMRLGVFGYLKTTVRQVTKPQKEITVKTTGAALESIGSGLPPDAMLVPVSGNPMSIFGLADEEMSWERFLQLTAGPHKESWREAITAVITSAQDNRIDVDNNQLVPSSDESKIYRIIMTTATQRWDDCQEFNLYFVEAYREEEYGNEDTTLTLKGLETTCRYRFMFLEDRSQFSANRILATREEALPELAAKLLRELNLMKTRAIRAGLTDPTFWSQFRGWSLILEVGAAYNDKEKTIRDLTGQILNARNSKGDLADLRKKLATAIGEMEDTSRKANAELIKAMSAALQDLVTS